MSTATVNIDLEDPTLVADPYPHLADWRDAGRAVYHEGLAMHLACTYADANAVLRSKSLGRIWVDRQPEDVWHVFNWLHSDSILESEPPKHTRLRSLVSQAFTRGRVEALRPTVLRLADELLQSALAVQADTGAFDLIADYAEPLPVAVIAELLGMPPSRRGDLRRWSQDIVRMYDYRRTPEDESQARASAEEFADLVAAIADDRRQDPGDDLISHLARAEAEGERLTERELVATAVLLLNAGHEASVNAFGNGMMALFDRPDALGALVANPRELAPTAIEEMLRFDSPLQLFERTATEEVEIAGVRLQPGEKIAALLGSANRDPRAFADADDFDVTRDPNPHIAFGAGIHFCLGAPLARLELSVTLPLLLERLPALHLAGEPVRRDTFVLRGYHHVPVAG